ncbi:MAG: fumarylacetoacetate hydrolase family protein [Rubrobacteraceae bacterium]
MKLVMYSVNSSDARAGFIEDGKVRQLAGEETSMISLIEEGAEKQPIGGESVAVEDVKLYAPIARPGKIIGIGLNYEDHAAETGADIPEKPTVFAKYPNTITGPGNSILIPKITEQADYEAELAVVIGRKARHVEAENALDYVFGYMNANDVSSRDLQFSEGGQWTRSKSIDSFAPTGPYLVTKDEIENPQNLSIKCTLNGEVMQEGNTEKMIFSVAEIVAFLSTGMTLEPGDIILTGTPPGVGVARDPKVFLKDGDEVSIEIEGLGTLTNPVEAE